MDQGFLNCRTKMFALYLVVYVCVRVTMLLLQYVLMSIFKAEI